MSKASGKRISKVLQRRRLQQKELAERIGITNQKGEYNDI